MTLKLLDPENHSITFWNLQFKIRLLEQQRCADRILQRENLACLRRMQLELSSVRNDWLKDDDDRSPRFRSCKLCGNAFVSGENTGRPRSYCERCFHLNRRAYWKSRYDLLKSKQNVIVQKMVKQNEVE